MTQTGPTRDKGEQFSRGPVRQPPIEPGTAEQPRRIAMLAPPWIPLPPPGYGGIEEVVALLTEALVDRGNDVELFCAPGSSSNAKLRPLLPTSHPESIERALFEADHVGRAFGRSTPPPPTTTRSTSSTTTAVTPRSRWPTESDSRWCTRSTGRSTRDTTPYYDHHGARDNVVCISRSQASFAPVGASVRAVVFNPIDIETWPVGFEKQDYLFWVGRFAPEKGAHRAIAVAKQARRRLILAGVVQSRQERFFANEIQPHIDGDQIQFVGEVGGARKRNLFAERGHS
jgi:glycosyltransferase involved in cell wall biosynthesis